MSALVDPAALRLAAIIASSEDAIISETLDGTIETWNRAAERLFGYTADEAVGLPIDVIVPPEMQDTEREAVARLRTGREVRHFDTMRLTKSGALVPVSVSLSPVVTPEGDLIGISRIVRDISREKALEREAFRLAAIVNSSDDAIASKDLNGIVQTWNKAAERMFGYSAAEIIGKPIRLIIPADRQGEEDEVLAKIRAGQSVEHFETIRQRKDGTPIEISLTVSPIRNAAGIVIGASKIARDITAQRRLARDAEAANRIKDDFLAMLSHELRTPLNAVLGYTRMLRSGEFSEGRREQIVDIIERNAKMLAQLVADLLDVSTIVSGKVRLKTSPCDVSTAVSAALDVVRPSAEAKGVGLRYEPSPVPARAMCDIDRIQQVFWNLLSNAVKFTPRGGSVTTRITVEGHHVVVTVTDTGIGVKGESLPHLFRRFWQAEHVHTRTIGGLGLGLALARHFVELHGGTIAAHSEGEGKGATFTVTLPLANA